MKTVPVSRPQAISRSASEGYFSLVGQPGKFPALDGLRAIAILLVLIRHAANVIADTNAISNAEAFWPQAITWLRNIAFNGWLGVDLFFVLSGCLIAMHLLKENEDRAKRYYFKPYILKRLCRTLPLYYASIFLIIFGVIPHYSPSVPNSSLEFIALAFFLQDYLGTHILVPLWSLAVEEKFYLLAPLLILMIRKAGATHRVIVLLFSLSLMAAMMRLFMVIELKPETYSSFFWRCRSPFSWDPIFFGVACAYLAFNHKVKQFVQKYDLFVIFSSVVVVLFLLCAQAWVESKNWIASSLVIYAVSFAFGCLVYTSIVSVRLENSFLASASLRVVSRLSYALYLTHYAVIPAASHISTRITGESAEASYVLCFLVLYMAFSFVFSVLLHFFIEKPFLLLKDRI